MLAFPKNYINFVSIDIQQHMICSSIVDFIPDIKVSIFPDNPVLKPVKTR